MTIWDWFKWFLYLFRRLLGLKIIAIDSNWESITEAAYDYRQANVYKHFKIRGFKIVRAQGSNADETYVEAQLTSRKGKKIVYITGVGHGNYDRYTGHNGDVVFQVGDNRKLVNNRVVHLLSCRTARDLGPDFVNDGCKAFFGYTENFSFYWGFEDIFFRCDSEIDKRFAYGATANIVYNKTKNIYEEAVDALIDEGHFYVAAVLQEDLDILRCPSIHANYGDKNARI